MAPSHSRHLLVWTTLPIAVLLSYLWFKRKRVEAQSDPGRNESLSTDHQEKIKTDRRAASPAVQLSSEDTLLSSSSSNASSVHSSPPQPIKTFSRSLSGVDSAPIDIIFPPELKSAKSSQVVISDEDLDLEIEKIKSMSKSSVDYFSKKKESPPTKATTPKNSKKDYQKVTLQKASPKKAPPSAKKEESCNKTKKLQSMSNNNNNKATEKSSSVNHINNNCNTVNHNNNNKQANNKNRKTEKMDVIEKKITSLKIDTKLTTQPPRQKTIEITADATTTTTTTPTPETVTVTENDQRQSSERDRDSANHSPADVMLASPSLSSISDTHSEGSNDSGKGGSEVATPPSRTPAGDGSIPGDENLPTLYQFVIPQSLVGKLIGKHGCSISVIKAKSRAQILIKKHPDTNTLKVCSLEGTQSEIDHALELIRNKFPLKRYPELTLEQVSILSPPTPVPVLTTPTSIRLIEGINNDTIVSCMVSPNHLFLQQPTHPTFPNLNVLSDFMNRCYADPNSPLLPNPIPENSIIAAFSLGAWYRALVLSTDSDTETSYVKFLDYGGYYNIKNSDLRKIRGDFLLLPFQSSECLLSNIRPKGENGEWSEDAFKFVAELTRGSIVYAQVENYTEDEVPLVLIYVILPPQRLIFLNQELVNRGYAEFIVDPAENMEGAVGGVLTA